MSHHPKRQRPAVRGFTLVELMVVCTLTGLLLGLAWPQWRTALLKGGRADAVHALTQLEQAQARYHAQHGLYAQQLSLLGPAVQSVSPQDRYDIVLESASGDGWRARARPRPGGPQSGDRACPSLEIEVRRGFATRGPDPRCWSA